MKTEQRIQMLFEKYQKLLNETLKVPNENEEYFSELRKEMKLVIAELNYLKKDVKKAYSLAPEHIWQYR